MAGNKGNIMSPAPAASAAQTLQENAATGGVAPAVETAVVPFKMPASFKVKRALTMPSLNLKPGPAMTGGGFGPGAGLIMRVMTNPVVSDVEDKSGQKAAAVVSDIIDVQTGEVLRWLIPSVALGNFIKVYGDQKPEAIAKAGALMDSAKDGKKTILQKNDAMRECLATAKVNIVGCVFAVQNMGKRNSSQRYWDYNVAELEEVKAA